MAVEVPEWAQYVATAIGLTLAAFAAKMGLGKTNGNATPVEVAGAIVDNKAAKEITDTIRTAMEHYAEIHEEMLELKKEDIKSRERLVAVVETLHQEVRQLTREIIAAASHRT